MTHLAKKLAATLILTTAACAGATEPLERGSRWVPVSGTGVHYFSSAIIHSQTPTKTGLIQYSTDTVELDGDIKGRVLYHPKSVFDFVAGTLVNTGSQVFSGTVLGSKPVLLHDDSFRFDVNLHTGETRGVIFLDERLAGARIRCRLEAFGTAGEPGEDVAINYTGFCRMPGGRQRGGLGLER
ncbi:MAG: hypothetical protein AAFQ62_11825 [Pseudomonadota bacterium]